MSQSLDELVDEILSSRKYRDLPAPRETVRDLLERELRQTRSQKEAVRAVRQKLHNIVAPYLGDPDYPQAQTLLEEAFAAEANSPQGQVREVCRGLLAQHASTRERLPLLEEGFYERIFEVTGRPQTLLDLACGLNPFTIPWMGLPAGTQYHVYDIHKPRVDLINRFFTLQGMSPLGEVRDVLLDPPQISADVAFLFKEAHRMEQRQRGCSRPFWQALNVRYLAVSLPAHSLSGRFDLVDRQRRLVDGVINGLPWRVTEVMVGGEMIFIIDRSPDSPVEGVP